MDRLKGKETWKKTHRSLPPSKGPVIDMLYGIQECNCISIFKKNIEQKQTRTSSACRILVCTKNIMFPYA